MKIYKITEASDYLGVSINTLKTLANNGKIKSFKTTGEHRRFRQEDLDAYMGIEKEKQEKLTVIYARCSTLKRRLLVRLIKINESTARDKKNKYWFRSKIDKQHQFWPRCSLCGKSTKDYWEQWPKTGVVVCNSCVEMEE